MGVKISSLSANTLPYTGSERIPLVQGGQTRGGTLSSFVNYLSGALLSDSELSALSGNWQNTYTTFRSNSANYAVKNADNSFSANQTFLGEDGIKVGNSTLFKEISNLASGKSFGIGDSILAGHGTSTFENNFVIGNESGYQLGSGSTEVSNSVSFGYRTNYQAGAGPAAILEDIISVGTYSGYQAGSYNTSVLQNIIFLGTNAGNNAGAGTPPTASGTTSTLQDSVFIGNRAGSYAGYSNDTSRTGYVKDLIGIGTDAVMSAGRGNLSSGSVDNLIAIGKAAGYQCGYETTSNNNIFIGLSSGYNKQGNRNTFIGDLTNTSPASAVGLSGCIAIGYGATPTARNTIAIGSSSTPLSVIPGSTLSNSISGLKIMINGTYYTIPLLA